MTSILLLLLLIAVWGYCSNYEDETYELSAFDQKATSYLNDTLIVPKAISMVALRMLDDTTSGNLWSDSTGKDKIFFSHTLNGAKTEISVSTIIDTLKKRSQDITATVRCIFAPADTFLSVSAYKTSDEAFMVLTVDQDAYKPVFFSDSTFDLAIYSSGGDKVQADNVTVPMEIVAFSPTMKSRFEFTLAKGSYLLQFVTGKKNFKFYSVSR
jgi:hypothetical protein